MLGARDRGSVASCFEIDLNDLPHFSVCFLHSAAISQPTHRGKWPAFRQGRQARALSMTELGSSSDVRHEQLPYGHARYPSTYGLRLGYHSMYIGHKMALLHNSQVHGCRTLSGQGYELIPELSELADSLVQSES